MPQGTHFKKGDFSVQKKSSLDEKMCWDEFSCEALYTRSASPFSIIYPLGVFYIHKGFFIFYSLLFHYFYHTNRRSVITYDMQEKYHSLAA